MSTLSRQDILGVSDRQYEVVEVPEWGGSVRVRSLSAKERDDFELAFVTKDKKGNREFNPQNVRATLVVLTAVDDDGNPLFQRSEAEVLGQKSAAAIERVYSVAAALSGLTDRDVEELLGNSKAAPSESSPSS